MDLPQHGAVVLEMLEHVERRHEVEALARERQWQRIDALHALDTPTPAELDGLLVRIYPAHLAVASEVHDHRAGSAPDVECLPPAFRLRRQVAIEHAQEDRPASEEPPVAVLELEVIRVEVAAHV